MSKRTINTLEDILLECFDCKKPFNKKGKLTLTGKKAYEKLIDTVCGLMYIGVIDIKSVDNVIKQLDEIVSGECY